MAFRSTEISGGSSRMASLIAASIAWGRCHLLPQLFGHLAVDLDEVRDITHPARSLRHARAVQHIMTPQLQARAAGTGLAETAQDRLRDHMLAGDLRRTRRRSCPGRIRKPGEPGTARTVGSQRRIQFCDVPIHQIGANADDEQQGTGAGLSFISGKHGQDRMQRWRKLANHERHAPPSMRRHPGPGNSSPTVGNYS
jgi:hypothetical protein